MRWETGTEPRSSGVLIVLPDDLRIASKSTWNPRSSLHLSYLHSFTIIHPLTRGLESESPHHPDHSNTSFSCVCIWWASSFCLSSHIPWDSLSPHLDPVTLVLSHAQHFLSQDVSLSCSWHLEYSFPHTSPNGG